MKYTKRQNEIIDTTLKLISESGFNSVTIRNLASKIGVTEPAIYRHFKSKFDILDAVLNRFEFESELLLEDLSNNDVSALSKVQIFVLSRYQMMQDNPDLAHVMFSEELFRHEPELSAKMLKTMHSHKEVIEKFVKQAQDDGEVRDDISSLFRFIIGPMRLLVKQWCLSGHKFDLKLEGDNLWHDTVLLIQKNGTK